MKRRRLERVERRRPTVEMNLIAERGADRVRRRGCLPLSVMSMAFGGALVTLMGMHYF